MYNDKDEYIKMERKFLNFTRMRKKINAKEKVLRNLSNCFQLPGQFSKIKISSKSAKTDLTNFSRN